MARSPHHSDVFSQLPALLMRELDTAEVAALVERLVAAGWRPGQLRTRVGAAPSQGAVERDARGVVELLSRLLEAVPPDLAHAEELRERERRRLEREAEDARAASPEVREAALARMRRDLGLPPRRRVQPQPRTRPACGLCDGEGSFFVTHDVHLCSRCVAVIAAGEVRLSRTG